MNYKYRMHDPRIGRFFARDPLAAKYPYYSPYAFSGNRVIDAVELEGLEPANYMNRETGDMVYNLDLGTSSFSVDWGDGLIYHWDFVSYYDPVLENPNSEVIILNLEKVEQNTCSPEIQTGESLVEDNKGEIQAESMLGTIVDDWTGALLDGSKETLERTDNLWIKKKSGEFFNGPQVSSTKALKGFWSTAAKKGAKRLPIVGYVMDGMEIATGIKKDGGWGKNATIETAGAAGGTLGGMGGAWGGALAGAAIGSAIPVVGTVVGGVIGGIVGAIVGGWGGEKAAEGITEKVLE